MLKTHSSNLNNDKYVIYTWLHNKMRHRLLLLIEEPAFFLAPHLQYFFKARNTLQLNHSSMRVSVKQTHRVSGLTICCDCYYIKVSCGCQAGGPSIPFVVPLITLKFIKFSGNSLHSTHTCWVKLPDIHPHFHQHWWTWQSITKYIPQDDCPCPL